MGSPLIMTQEALDELIFALRTSLQRVQIDELDSPRAKMEWRKVAQWIDQMERSCQGYGADVEFARLKSFPISGAELRALAMAVNRSVHNRRSNKQPLQPDDAERLHESEIASPPKTTLFRLHKALDHVHSSSLILAILLGSSLAINVGTLLIESNISLPMLVSVNIVVLSVAMLVWLILHHNLRHHRRLLHWHVPSPSP